ncbi:MAG: efflux RND transporter periplasmic adaptor subunit [Campylobacterota bacterium]
MRLLLILLPLILFAKEATVKQLFNVQTTEVKKVQTSHSKKNYGYVKADEALTYTVSPRFSGYVVKLYADKRYKKVEKGDALVSVYSPEVYKAKEEYLNSYNYSKNRKNKGMLESAKLKLELLGVSPNEIKSVIKSKKVSQNTTIYSPVNGYIFSKSIMSGSAFSAKNKLFEIVNLDEVWVEAKILEDDLEWIDNARKFDVSFKSRPRTYSATSTLLYPTLDEKEATLTLRLRLKNQDNRIFPGMYATLISSSESQEYLTLKRTAVIRKNGKYYAFVVGDFQGEYEPIEIQTRELDSETYIVTGGLNVDDEVVDNALFMMDSDAQINGLY